MDPALWTTLDLLIRLLPAGAIIVAILVARRQLAAARRATQLTIAKNHYRSFISLAVRHADIAYRGATEEALAQLKAEPEAYRRYRWLATQAMFALQELYFATGAEPHWRQSVRVLASNFRAFILSPVDWPPRQRAALHPEFMGFLERELQGFEAPILATGVPVASS